MKLVLYETLWNKTNWFITQAVIYRLQRKYKSKGETEFQIALWIFQLLGLMMKKPRITINETMVIMLLVILKESIWHPSIRQQQNARKGAARLPAILNSETTICSSSKRNKYCNTVKRNK